MQKLELSSVDVGNVVKKLMNKFVNNTLEVDELYYSKNFKKYADECVSREFYRKMRYYFMNSRVHIDKFLGKQLKIIRWLEIKQCTKNKCGQWLDIYSCLDDGCPKCEIKKEENQKKLEYEFLNPLLTHYTSKIYPYITLLMILYCINLLLIVIILVLIIMFNRKK